MLKSFQIGIAYKRNFLGRYTCKKSPRVIKGQKPSKFRKFFSKKSTFFCIFSILEVDGLFFQYLSPFPCVWTAARFLIPSKSGSRYKCSLEPRALQILHWGSREPQWRPSQAIRSSTSSALPKWRRGPQTQDPKLTWLVLGEDQAARSHRVEQLTALWGL